MAKKRTGDDVYTRDNNLYKEDISEAMTSAMLIFGANTNLMRQIPNLQDGLKPVERRILYTMFKLGLKPTGSPMKSARIVGDTMSTYHPHGDTTIYDVLVRLTQNWNMYVPLASEDGAFGTQYDGEGSAMRYTETKLTHFAWDCYFSDFNIYNVFYRNTYDGKNIEPEFLPSRYPVGLVNGTFGIGNGIKVDIPQHNLQEVLEFTIHRIEHPSSSYVPFYPDSATYCDIVKGPELETMFKTGKGKIRYRGKIDIDYKENTILIYNPPPKVYLDGVIKRIGELRTKDIIKGMVNMDRCDVEGSPGIVYFFKKEIDLDEVRNIMYKNTGMDTTLPVNFIMLDNYKEASYGFIDYIDEWIEIRRDYKNRIYTKQLIDLNEKIHILEILLRIFDGNNASKTIEYIKKHKKHQVIPYLMEKYEISSLQARTITEMRIGDFSEDTMEENKAKLPKIKKEKKEVTKILNSSEMIDKIIIDELKDGVEKYGSPRRSEIIDLEGVADIPNTRHRVVVTSKGKIKKLSIATSNIGELDEGDIPVDIIEINNREDLMVIDTSGMIHKLPVSSLSNSELSAHGDNIADHIKLKGDICNILPKPNADTIKEENDIYLILVTKNGIIKKTNVFEFVNMKSSVIGMKVDKGDEVIAVKLIIGEANDVLIYTENGMGMRYPSSEIKKTGRSSKGIIAINMDGDDRVKGVEVVKEKDKFILCLTDKGRAKKCELSQFRTMKKTTKALRLITLDDNESIKLIQTIKGKEEFKVFMKNDILTLKAKDVDVLPRLSKGNKVIPVRKGDHIIDIKILDK